MNTPELAQKFLTETRSFAARNMNTRIGSISVGAVQRAYLRNPSEVLRTRVRPSTRMLRMYRYHDSCIAMMTISDSGRTELYITNAGYPTRSTNDRLNSILREHGPKPFVRVGTSKGRGRLSVGSLPDCLDFDLDERLTSVRKAQILWRKEHLPMRGPEGQALWHSEVDLAYIRESVSYVTIQELIDVQA